MKKNTEKYITFSIDDGNKLDLKVLELLEKYNIKATFYIPKKFHLKTLTDKEIKLISQTQEIGGHTLNHVHLNTLSTDEQTKEILGSKKYLEVLIGRQALMFSYPNGDYNETSISMVKRAGFKGARTTNCCYFKIDDPFQMPVSLQIYPFPLLKKTSEYSYLFWIRHILDQHNEYKKFIKQYNLGLNFSWFQLAKSMLEYNRDVFHIWGHSWEIEKFNMWKDLEKLFKYISDRNIKCLINSEVI